MNDVLMKIQIGPVQEFIVQARSTRDMWAGSYLLSRLAARAMEVFDKAGCRFVFPTLEKQPLYEMVTGTNIDHEKGLIPTLPNVFLVRVASREKAEELAGDSLNAIRNELKRLGDECWKWMTDKNAENSWKERWDRQLSVFPSLTWHAVGMQKSWSSTVKLLGEQLAARRHTRDFAQWGVIFNDKGEVQFDSTLEKTPKDVLSGKEEIIGDEAFWKNIQNCSEIKKTGPLGTMNLIKRLFPYCCFPGTESYWDQLSMENTRDMAKKNVSRKGFNPYIAIIALDGDRMGAALRKLDSHEQHTEFSRTVAGFAEDKVKVLVDKFKGELIYAGGDDVLAMCPASQALALAEELRSEFRNHMKEYQLDASCGIAAGHYKYPLQRIVEEARVAEARAKNERGRAAFSLSLLKRSGEILHWGAKWECNALDVYTDFNEKAEQEVFSGRFPYVLAELLQPYRLGEDSRIDLKPIIEKEFLHVQVRQALQKGAKVNGARVYLAGLDAKRLEDFPNLFLASAFMNRQWGDD